MIMRRNKYICHFKVYRTVIRQRKYIFWDQPKLAERRIKKKKTSEFLKQTVVYSNKWNKSGSHNRKKKKKTNPCWVLPNL